MWNVFQIQLRLGLLIAMLGLVVSCLITNCPRGGKRARADEPPEKTTCVSCGPEGQGVCLGRNICCGRGIGCLTTSRYTEVCRSVPSFRASCLSELTDRTCGDRGKCRAKYICCSNDQCSLDLSCKFLPLDMYNSFDGLTLASRRYAPIAERGSPQSPPDNRLESGNVWKSSKDESTVVQSDYES